MSGNVRTLYDRGIFVHGRSGRVSENRLSGFLGLFKERRIECLEETIPALAAAGRNIKIAVSGRKNLLFHFYGDSFDWLSTTGYGEEVRLVQQALSFNLYILKMKAQEYLWEDELSDCFRKAFPQGRELDRPFVFLFLDRFCLYFGLVDREKDKKVRYRTSSLFTQLLEWRV